MGTLGEEDFQPWERKRADTPPETPYVLPPPEVSRTIAESVVSRMYSQPESINFMLLGNFFGALTLLADDKLLVSCAEAISAHPKQVSPSNLLAELPKLLQRLPSPKQSEKEEAPRKRHPAADALIAGIIANRGKGISRYSQLAPLFQSMITIGDSELMNSLADTIASKSASDLIEQLPAPYRVRLLSKIQDAYQ